MFLYNGQCLTECPMGTYYDEETEACRGKKKKNNPAQHLGSLVRWVSAQTKQPLGSAHFQPKPSSYP
jgi:hypothetical protein